MSKGFGYVLMILNTGLTSEGLICVAKKNIWVAKHSDSRKIISYTQPNLYENIGNKGNINVEIFENLSSQKKNDHM